jgi:lipopolysaccharide export system permease protein
MMPDLITRYVLWEMTKIFLISSCCFVGLMVIIGLADEAMSKGIGPEIIIKLIPYVIPKALMFALPATCLFSVCVVFGRLSAENELTAIESMGVPKSVLILPALILAFLVSLVAVWLNDIAFAWSHWGVERVILESSDKIVYGVLRKEGAFTTPQFSIEVDGIDERKLIHPVITIKNVSSGNVRIVAHEGELVANPNTQSLSFTMRKGLIESAKVSMTFDDSLTHEIPLRSPEELAKATGNPNNLYLSQVKRAIARQTDYLKQQNAIESTLLASQLLSGDFKSLANSRWERRRELAKEENYRLNRLKMVPHRRWANGFSCLAFVFIGIPVAIRMKTNNYSTTFGACFLPILLTYYPLFMLGLEGAKSGMLPSYAAWLGNLVCIVVGWLLLVVALRR